MKSYRQIKAIEQKYKKKILENNLSVDEKSGIYILIREDEEGIKYAYIGQAKHLLTRLAQHLVGHQQHIDLSLKSHGLKAVDNPHGWEIITRHAKENDLDELEKWYIKYYADSGYQLRNKTAGGQGKGKKKIDEYRPRKGYRDGIAQGEKKCSKEVAHLFEKHLNVSCKSDPPTKLQERALEKFNAFISVHKGDVEANE